MKASKLKLNAGKMKYRITNSGIYAALIKNLIYYLKLNLNITYCFK